MTATTRSQIHESRSTSHANVFPEKKEKFLKRKRANRLKLKLDSIANRIAPEEPSLLSKYQLCKHCNAKRFTHESTSFCCSTGQIQLHSTGVPTKLKDLFVSTSADSIHFRTYVRSYNNSFAFTSFGVKSDREFTKRNKGVYTFKAQGQIYHYINNLLPENEQPRYLQLYFYDTDHEVENRRQTCPQLRDNLVKIIMDILSINPYARFFRTLRELNVDEHTRIIIRADANVDQRVFNTPTTSQVAAIWIEPESCSTQRTRDILVFGKSGCNHKIMHYYSCYDPLQYPLLFPYGEAGWHEGIKKSKKKTKAQPTQNDDSTRPMNMQTEDDLIRKEKTGTFI